MHGNLKKRGNIRNKNYDFYSVYKTKLITYHHGIIKGKWLPKTYAYLKNEGYTLDENNFDSYSKIQVFNINIYTAAFNVFKIITSIQITIINGININNVQKCTFSHNRLYS